MEERASPLRAALLEAEELDGWSAGQLGGFHRNQEVDPTEGRGPWKAMPSVALRCEGRLSSTDLRRGGETTGRLDSGQAKR